jgi:hypothetical protein
MVFWVKKKFSEKCFVEQKERNVKKKVYSLDKVLIYDAKFVFIFFFRRQYEAAQSLYPPMNKGKSTVKHTHIHTILSHIHPA